MTNSVLGSVIDGFEATAIDIECHLSNSLPTISIVGMGSKSVDEAKERVRSAVTSSGLTVPRKRVIINLAPAELPKRGASLDLGIAIALVVSDGQIPFEVIKDTLFIGELALDGSLRAVNGIIGYVSLAKRLGLKVVIPRDNYRQASLIEGVEIIPVTDLAQLFGYLSDSLHLNYPAKIKIAATTSSGALRNILGQYAAKRALTVAVAGKHNMLLSGPPGTGKTMLAKSAADLMPELLRTEVEELTHLHSLSTNSLEIITDRPFRAPHHTASHISLVGGGKNPRPGEISLAHYGVLFLDELLEFPRQTLDTLRQPLEDKKVRIVRTESTAEFPADVMAIAALNPCPCGNFGQTTKSCTCSTQLINKYQQKLSGPLLDRFDISIYVDRIKISELQSKAVTDLNYAKIVSKAWQVQRQRNPGGVFNSALDLKQLKNYLEDKNLDKYLNNIADKLLLSMRGYTRVLRVARTIADIDGSEFIKRPHLNEALSYRHHPTAEPIYSDTTVATV